MISDSGQDDNNKPCEAMGMTRIKRDEFLVEIRKKKSHNIVNEKRLKVSQGNSNSEACPFIALNALHNQNFNGMEMIENNMNALSEYEIQLKLQLTRFFEAFQTENWEELVMILQFFRESVGSSDCWVSGRTIIEMGIIPNVLYLLEEKFNPICRMQSEASWLIANVTAGDVQDNNFLVQQGCIPVLRECLKAKNEDLQENALWALSNIASEREIDFREHIHGAGVFEEVIRQLNRTTKRPSYSRTAAYFISHIMRKPYPDFDQVSCCVGSLSQLIGVADQETQKQVLVSLSCFSDLDDFAKLDVIAAHQLIPKIVRFIGNENLMITHYALKTAGNLSQGHSKIITKMCQSDILQALAKVLKFKEGEIRKEACFTLSNILVENTDANDCVVENKLMPILLEIMAEDLTEIRLEATMCVYAYMHKSCSLKGCQLLVSKNLIEILLANMIENDKKLIINSIHTLSQVLRFGVNLEEGGYDGVNPYAQRVMSQEGVQILEDLQSHPDTDVYDEVAKLIDTYFQIIQS